MPHASQKKKKFDPNKEQIGQEFRFEDISLLNFSGYYFQNTLKEIPNCFYVGTNGNCINGLHPKPTSNLTEKI